MKKIVNVLSAIAGIVMVASEQSDGTLGWIALVGVAMIIFSAREHILSSH